MFVEIYNNGSGYWEIKDTKFTANSGYPCFGYPAAEAIIFTYEYFHLSPIQPLQAYYERFNKKHRMSSLHQNINDMGPTGRVAFQIQYYRCVKNHMDKLDWIGK